MKAVVTDMQYKHNRALEDRVTTLYRTKYKREVRREGLRGMEMYAEGMKRAYKQMMEEYKAVNVTRGEWKRTPPSDVGSNKELLAILPKRSQN